MSRLSGRTAVERECHVLGCTSTAGSLTCRGQDCTHKLCTLHYGKSILCRSCSQRSESSIRLQRSESSITDETPAFEILDISPEKRRSKFNKSKFFKNWSDDAMVHLCKQVQMNQAHYKTGDAMPIKWTRVSDSLFSSFSSLERCKWQALQKHYLSTARALQEFAVTNQHTNLSAEELEPGDWQTIMLSTLFEAEEAELSRKSSQEKVSRDKKSMALIEDQILNGSDVEVDSSNDESAVGEDVVTSNTITVPPTKRAKTSIRSASPLQFFDPTANAETDKILAEVTHLAL